MPVLISIIQAGTLLLQFIIPLEQWIAEERKMAILSPDVQVNITTLTGDAISDNDAAIAAIAAWKARHNLS